MKKLLYLVCSLSLVMSACKKKSEEDPGNNQGTTPTAKDRVLLIEQGATSVPLGQTTSFSAVFVKTDGTTEAASGVSWSSSDQNIATINSSGVLSSGGLGSIQVTASASVSGNTYSVKVPVSIKAQLPFAVAPSGIIGETNDSYQLNVVNFSISNPTYTYSSDDANIASVNSNGLVTLNAIGFTVISVTSSDNPNSSFTVPVQVVEPITIPLPVVKVEVTPGSAQKFRGQTQQFSATAYDIDDNVVSTTISWASLDPSIATVDASGLATAVNIGETKIHAIANGMIGEATLVVNPDTVVIVSPFFSAIAPSKNKQFTANAYDARNSMTLLSGITNFNWSVPSYGFPIFDVATVNTTGLVTAKSSATPGMFSFVIAQIPSNPDVLIGAAQLMITDCDCGAGNANVASIEVTNSMPITLNMFSPPTFLNAIGKDATNNNVTNPALKFCSSDFNTVSIDEDTGEMFASAPGTVDITICSGNYATKTIQVTVQ